MPISEEQEPPFVPREGQIDYTHARRAPVLNCVVVHQGKILLVQRSRGMRFFPGAWNGISGFLDDPAKTVADMAFEELHEELGIAKEDVLALREGETFEQEDEENNKTWIVHPVLAEVSTDELTLNWEGRDHAWIAPEEVRQYDLLPDFDKVLDAFSL